MTKPEDKTAEIPVVFEVGKEQLVLAVREAVTQSPDGERLLSSMTTTEFAAYFIDLQKARQYIQANMEHETMEGVLKDIKGLGSVAAATLPFRLRSAEDVDRLSADLKNTLKNAPTKIEIAVIVAQVDGKGEYRLCPS